MTSEVILGIVGLLFLCVISLWCLTDIILGSGISFDKKEKWIARLIVFFPITLPIAPFVFLGCVFFAACTFIVYIIVEGAEVFISSFKKAKLFERTPKEPRND